MTPKKLGRPFLVDHNHRKLVSSYSLTKAMKAFIKSKGGSCYIRDLVASEMMKEGADNVSI